MAKKVLEWAEWLAATYQLDTTVLTTVEALEDEVFAMAFEAAEGVEEDGRANWDNVHQQYQEYRQGAAK